MLEGFYKEYGRKKVYICLVCLLVVLNIASSVILYKSKLSFSIEGERFKYTFRAFGQIGFKDSKGNAVVEAINNLAKETDPSTNRFQYKINEVNDFLNEDSFIWILLMTIPLIILGLAHYIYPEKLWRFKHILDVYGGEPTDFAIYSHKLGGIIAILLSLIFPIFIMFL